MTLRCFTLLAALIPISAIPTSVLLSQIKTSDDSDPKVLYQSVEKWIELRREDEKMKSDWKWQKSVLENTQLALQKQIEIKTKELEQFKSDHSSQIEELHMLEQEQSELKQVYSSSEQQVEEEILEFVSIKDRLPPRLNKALELSFASLVDRSLPLNDRFQILVSSMGRVSQFNHLISYSEEIVIMDGKPRLMAVLYWGLSHAYALDLSENEAFVGRPNDKQWAWTPSRKLKGNIQQMLSIFREETDPVFVDAPVTLN